MELDGISGNNGIENGQKGILQKDYKHAGPEYRMGDPSHQV